MVEEEEVAEVEMEMEVVVMDSAEALVGTLMGATVITLAMVEVVEAITIMDGEIVGR